MSDARDAGYDDFLDALEDGEPYYFESPTGDGWLPPVTVDPETGAGDLERKALPIDGEILTHTTIHVATPQFAEDAPVVVAVGSFGPVNVTGQVREIEPEAVEIGLPVELAVDRSKTTGDRVLVFRPA